jgi:hypothetical protein
MSVNNMSFEQAATLLNAVHAQVTGVTTLAPTDVSGFISVAQKTLAAGYDPVLNAISQVVGRTIFSVRPYDAKFRGIQADTQKWGAITRKLVIADKPLQDNKAFDLIDGQSVDMYEVNKPNVLQLNFYGALEYSKSFTIFRSQLDAAFNGGPTEFGRFMAMVTQNALDMIEQTRETCARLALCNFIAGKIDATADVIHLLSEYNSEVGGSFTTTTIKDPANFPAFVKWVYARIATLTNMMTERSALYQIQVTGQEVMRHTPFERQKVYILNWLLNNIDARVLADTYNYKFLEFADVEAVNFWQAIDSPDEISITPTYLDGTTGALVTGTAVTQTDVMGVIFDEEALGYTLMNEFSGVTPMNVRGEYWNQYYNYVLRYWNDFTEKGLVLLLD